MRIVRALWLPALLTVLFTAAAISLVEVNVIGALVTAALAFGFSLDTWGRHYEYQYLTKEYKKRSAIRYWVMFQNTRCAREVMIAIDPQASDFYHVRGYRWYHFIPDNFIRRVHTKSFWKTAFSHRKFS